MSPWPSDLNLTFRVGFLSGRIIIPYPPDTLSAPSYSEQEQECCVRKTADETVTQSKEFITLMASYQLPVIQSFGKNVL